jgi:hypothetical protein
MGAVAVAAVMAVLPSAAVADDGYSVVQFKLPNKATMEQLEAQGADFDHGFIDAPGGGILVSAVVNDAEKALFEAQGYPAVKTLQTQADVDALRAERDATIAAEEAAKDALSGSSARKAKSVAAGTVRAQRADYWEDVSGRYLSIEGTTTEAAITPPRTYSGPPLQAAWFGDDGTQLGTGQLNPLLDTDVNPAAYLYHGSRFRVGNVGEGGMPAYVLVSAPNGDVARLDVKKWVGNGGTESPGGFIEDFNTHYVTPRESYAKMRELANEFPNVSTLMRLPNKTNGYQRKAQTVIGNGTPYTGQTSIANQASAVILTSLAWGHEGGNTLKAEIVNDGASKPLTVSVAGTTITVHAATDDAGAITSTAAEVVDAINASDAAKALVTAAKYRTNTGAGVVAATAVSNLSDWLKAPTSQPRGPIEVQGLRIGNDKGKPQGQKVGVFIYCQEHAREWGTPLVCLETAERLVRNYGVDPETTQLIDGLDIFIIPSINADGATYSMFDFNSQRRNMVNYCATNPTGNNDPAARNSWGVDLNRNFSVGSVFDGFVGASATSCTSDTYAGPFEFSEPEARNEQYVQTTYPNIKFAMNVHSSGGYFMWPPGAYKADRTTLPYPPYGTLNYFDQTASSVLERIYSFRKTAILPSQTGPVTDVLYSAAGNSADEAYYNHGIIGYDFEIGATKRLADGTTASPGFQPPFGAVPIGGNANLANEGHDEGMEFSDGNYALLASALDYANDVTPPSSEATGATLSKEPVGVKFTTSEAASIYYTTDGSTPTTASTEFKPNRPRELPDPVLLDKNTTLKWIAVDFKGNTSAVQSKSYVIDLVGPTVAFTSPAADGAVFTQGRPVPVAFTCADENSGVASCVGSPALGANLDTSTVGTFTYSVTAKDNAGNETTVTRSYTVIQATNVDGGLNGSVPATLAVTLGAAPTFGTFVPGLGREYTASTTAMVTSSAGDATLTVADPSSNHTGHLVNGSFFLAQPLQGLGTIKTWSAPTTGEIVPVTFKQAIGASEGLRTGAYGKTLTFTLSTTTP